MINTDPTKPLTPVQRFLKSSAEARAAKSQADRHDSIIQSNKQTQDTILGVAQALVDYIDSRIGKTEVTNHPTEMSVPEIKELKSAVEQLTKLVKTHENTDVKPVVEAIQANTKHLKKLPTQYPETVIPEEMKVSNFIDYKKDFKELKAAIEANKPVPAKAPKIITEAPNLEPITKAIQAIEIPKPVTPYKSKFKPKVDSYGRLETTQNNTLVTEPFDSWLIIEEEAFDPDSSDKPRIVGMKYFNGQEQVAQVKYIYKEDRIVGAKRVKFKGSK